jgi:A/G-specific adenine glycosylase
MRVAPLAPSQTNERKFRKLLLRWFDREKRILPWRGERDPYSILVSEVMLQQTRVAVVKERYKKFLGQFPSVGRLSRASEQTVLAAWSGLGYYRRARSLHDAAKQIERAGSFPRSSADLRELPGVGRYTANAVASIALNEAVPVVDGNVKRVLERFTARPLRQEQCWEAAGRLLDTRRPGDFNQAMMELGALVCLPGTPLCRQCPVAGLCLSEGAKSRREHAPRKKAIVNYVLICRHDSVLLQQRPRESSLMPDMWELPLLKAAPAGKAPLFTLRHSITVTDYAVRVFAGNSRCPQGRWVKLRSAAKLPLTGLARKILERLDHSQRNAVFGSTRAARRAGM